MIEFTKRLTFTIASAALAASMVGCSGDSSLASLDHSSTLTLEQSPIVRKAPSSGQLSVFDLNQQRVVFSGYVKKDDVITLDPATRQLTVGSDIAAEKLGGGDEFQLAFTPAE
jgi:hypothetical protein